MGKIGPKFSHLLSIRAEGTDPPPYGKPDRKKTVFFYDFPYIKSQMFFTWRKVCDLFVLNLFQMPFTWRSPAHNFRKTLWKLFALNLLSNAFHLAVRECEYVLHGWEVVVKHIPRNIHWTEVSVIRIPYHNLYNRDKMTKSLRFNPDSTIYVINLKTCHTPYQRQLGSGSFSTKNRW